MCEKLPAMGKTFLSITDEPLTGKVIVGVIGGEGRLSIIQKIAEKYPEAVIIEDMDVVIEEKKPDLELLVKELNNGFNKMIDHEPERIPFKVPVWTGKKR